MGFTFTTIIIAVLAGFGATHLWKKNAFLGLVLAAVCGVASILAFFALLTAAVALTFKLLPLIAVAAVGYFIYRAIRSRNDANPASSSPSFTE